MKYESGILETIHESAIEKFRIGAISEERMREYDKMCLLQEDGVSSEETDAILETEKIERARLVTV
jgi:DNA-binding transcriptional regulator YiaG